MLELKLNPNVCKKIRNGDVGGQSIYDDINIKIYILMTTYSIIEFYILSIIKKMMKPRLQIYGSRPETVPK